MAHLASEILRREQPPGGVRYEQTSMSAPAIASSAELSPARPPRSRLRWLTRTAMMLAGLAVGLGAAELVFRHRDHNAFPHLNTYVSDPLLGVRLRPGAEEDVAFSGNPVTHVRINSAGYRGGELPAPGGDDVLVVGDSQVFGLGVEEDETFAARLAGAIHRPVMNGGVPTYGPDEYKAVIAEQLAARHPRTVVLAINLVNDLFEAQHPNRDRHVVWDGWAVRKERAPEHVTAFPGREWLFQQSHLFFALRKWRQGDDRSDERGLASEGTWRDLVATGAHVTEGHAAADAARKKHLSEVTAAHSAYAASEEKLDAKLDELLGQDHYAPYSEQVFKDKVSLFNAHASPGDIVVDSFGEGSRSSIGTADQIATAVAVRARLRKELAAWARQHTATKDGKQAQASLDALEQAAAKLTAVDIENIQAALDPPLGAYLRGVKQLTDQAGARLVVMILPIDVQVSPQEWTKYGAQPIDMTPSKALTDELVTLCHALGVSVLDATPVLAAAEPGAFLWGDIHMTPKGHAAVATALAKTLREPAPQPAIASQRSPVPLPDVFRRAAEVIVTGSSDAGCETKQVREWLRIQCPRTDTTMPRDLQITRDDGHEAMALVMPDEMSLLVPVIEGRELSATFSWNDKLRVLSVVWPRGEKAPTMAFDKPVKNPHATTLEVDPFTPAPRVFRSEVERTICACWQHVFEPGAARDVTRKGPTCRGAYGAADGDCVTRYATSCPELLGCIRRDPASPR